MIIIPMAGNSRRFTEAGYDKPKFMLQLAGESLFAHSVRSFERYFAAEPFLFIARDDVDAGPFIAEEVARLGIADVQTVLLSEPTEGQAQTVQFGLDSAGISDEDALTIFNIDTFRPGFVYPKKFWFPHADGYLEVMRSTDSGFSFARSDPAGEDRVAETAEKRVISDLASTGLYWFRKAGMFRKIMATGGMRAHGELYVAPMYNAMIELGQDVRYEEIAAENVIFCGIPAQYHSLQTEFATRND